MEEFEKTYLVKYLPTDLKKFPSKEIIDLYIPENFDHPKIRIRKNGNQYTITKKEPIRGRDSSHQLEQTIQITKDEFDELKKLPAKRVGKKRYIYKYNKREAEIDVFQDALSGLVLADFEFKNNSEKDKFKMPEFCLADVTQEKFAAGGMLCGKKYSDIEPELKQHKYNKLSW